MKYKRKTGRKLFVSFGVLLSVAFSLVGCGNNNSKTTQGGTGVPTADKSSPAESIKIENIVWSVEEGILDGQRIVSFNYTNNSKYTITNVELKFVQKESTTAKQRALFNKFTASLKWSDEQKKGFTSWVITVSLLTREKQWQIHLV